MIVLVSSNEALNTGGGRRERRGGGWRGGVGGFHTLTQKDTSRRDVSPGEPHAVLIASILLWSHGAGNLKLGYELTYSHLLFHLYSEKWLCMRLCALCI